MKGKTVHIGLLVLTCILFIMPKLVDAEDTEIYRYYFKEGTFYKHTASSLHEYFQLNRGEQGKRIANIDWKELNNLTLAWRAEKEEVKQEAKHTKIKQGSQQKEQQAAPPTQGPATKDKVEKPTEKQPEEKTDQTTKISQREFEQEVIRLTNIERERAGLAPLQLDNQLSEVARRKSVDMATENYFSHESPTYGSPFDMIESFGITYYSAGENIAKGQTSPQEVVQAWMDSEGHRQNILHPDFTHIGVGFTQEGYHWTQQFIKKLDQSVNESTYEQQVVDLTNQEREKHGLAPLSVDTKLGEVARAKSKDMAEKDYFDHTSPTYGSPFDMMDQYGVSYQIAGENIARGQFTPEEVVEAWMNSEGHRENILNPDFTHIGVGFVKEDILWTQQFIKKK